MVMKNIFRLPVDYSHYKISIEEGKDFDWIKKFLTLDEIKNIESLSVSGKLKYWGSTPGSSNFRFWERMEPGDEVIFYREGKYIGLGIVGAKINNKELAEATWGIRKDGLTWQLVYFLIDIKKFEIDSSILNQSLGYSAGPVMGFSAISEKTAKPIIAKFGGISKFLEDFKLTKGKEVEQQLIQKPEEAEYFLLDLGKLIGAKTFSPDFGRSAFGKKLAELCDYTSILELLPPKIVDTARYIDVLWFTNHSPDYAFEVIHHTGMQDAFVRFQNLKQFFRSSSLYIIGPLEVEGDFEKVRRKFTSLSDEVKFNSYNNLIELHSSVVESEEKKRNFSIIK